MLTVLDGKDGYIRGVTLLGHLFLGFITTGLEGGHLSSNIRDGAAMSSNTVVPDVALQ